LKVVYSDHLTNLSHNAVWSDTIDKQTNRWLLLVAPQPFSSTLISNTGVWCAACSKIEGFRFHLPNLQNHQKLDQRTSLCATNLIVPPLGFTSIHQMSIFYPMLILQLASYTEICIHAKRLNKSYTNGFHKVDEITALRSMFDHSLDENSFTSHVSMVRKILICPQVLWHASNGRNWITQGLHYCNSLVAMFSSHASSREVGFFPGVAGMWRQPPIKDTFRIRIS
jgi:hypothetical protein